MKEFIEGFLFTSCMIILAISCNKEKKYCGEIIEKGYEQPSSGYKTHTEPNYFLIMRVDSINKCIRINTTVTTYYSLDKGSRACFDLTESELQSYGNANEHLIK